MTTRIRPRARRRTWLVGIAAAGATLAAGLTLPAAFAATRPSTPHPVTPPAVPGVPAAPGPVAPATTPAPGGLKLLKATPDTGPPGTPFVLAGSGLPANTDVDITWSSANKRYLLDVVPDSVDFWGRQIDPVQLVIAKGRTDAAGNLKLDLKFPQDYGSLHDIYAVANGVQIAKGGVLVERTYDVAPLKGPIGTTITIKLNGLGWKAYEDTVGVIWDNRYVGFLSSVTTRGQAVATIRAAGPPGRHTLELVPASATTPFLNIGQSAIGYLGYKRYTFLVTKDAGPPPTSITWPVNVKPTDEAKTTTIATTAAGVKASLSETFGPILSKTRLTASGLTPGPAQLQWISSIGTRTGAGWNLTTTPLGGPLTVAADGTLTTPVSIPDDVGGWHSVQIVQGGNVKATVPYRLDQSVAGTSPIRVKRGQHFQIHLKGVGFTELDNILAVTVDNSYIGYACGFFSAGDTLIDLIASGEPGTHIVDVTPTIYKQKGSDQWYGGTPFLTYRTDYPMLALGYRLPAYHFAYEIVK